MRLFAAGVQAGMEDIRAAEPEAPFITSRWQRVDKTTGSNHLQCTDSIAAAAIRTMEQHTVIDIYIREIYI